MITFTAIILFLVFCAIDYVLAKEFYRAAVMKGHAEKKYYWFCIFLTLGGYLLILTLPDRGNVTIGGVISCEDLPEIEVGK